MQDDVLLTFRAFIKISLLGRELFIREKKKNLENIARKVESNHCGANHLQV